MPVQRDTPISTGTPNRWSPYGNTSSKVTAVATDNGNTSVIYAATGGRGLEQDFNFPLITGATDPVNSATLGANTRCYLIGGGGRKYYLRWNGEKVGSNQEGPVKLRKPSYYLCTYSASGSELAVDRVNGEHGVQFNAAGGPRNKAEYWVTYLYREIDFDYSGTGGGGPFAHLIGTFVGGMIGGGLFLGQMRAVSAEIARKSGIWLRDDELEPAFRAWTGRKWLVAA